MKVTMTRAIAADVPEIVVMVGALLHEIMQATGVQAFHFDSNETTTRLHAFIQQERYFVFVARDGGGNPVGFIALYEAYALYASGVFGTIPELYVRPKFRNGGIGLQLVAQAKSFALARGWKRLEVTTPPLPQFERTLAFYEREGFSISGGRKLKISLE